MPIVFEDPPSIDGPAARFTRERSPERKEMDDMLAQLVDYPDQWARLYDFPEAGKEDAEKHAGKIRSAAGYMQTGHGWSVTVRQTNQGWSVFAKMSSGPPRQRTKKTEQPQDQVSHDSQAETAEQVREPTFQ